MNLENKKQMITITLALAFGCLAAFLMSEYVRGRIQEQTAQLSAEFKQEKDALLNQLDLMRKDMAQLVHKQKQMETQIKEFKEQGFAQVAAGGGTEKKPVVPMTSFSIRTPPGKRALTISISSLNAVGGLIAPGDFVDIIGEMNIPDEYSSGGSKKRDVTSVLFQNIQVLSVNTNFRPLEGTEQYAQQQRSKSLNVTLAVTPEEAGLITFAQANGQLKLALRPPEEKENWVLQVSSWDSLADFVLEHQGTELILPPGQAPITTVEGGGEEPKPEIIIFRSSRESNL